MEADEVSVLDGSSFAGRGEEPCRSTTNRSGYRRQWTEEEPIGRTATRLEVLQYHLILHRCKMGFELYHDTKLALRWGSVAGAYDFQRGLMRWPAER